MRVVAGEFKSRRLQAPVGEHTRPTTDRVREAVYSSVISELGDLSATCALDAFAGSGALGIEGLSRGLASCLFFETDRSARRVLQQNLDALGLEPPRAQVSPADVVRASEHPLRRGDPFGLVLLDPPYQSAATEACAFLSRLAANGDLADGALVVYEHALDDADAVAEAFAATDGFELLRQRRFGKTTVSYASFSA